MSGLDRFTRILYWNLLKYFVQIARSGSIGMAASNLKISQPSVSAALRKLEEHLGVQLFVRTRKGVQLTAAGEFLIEDCEKIVQAISAFPASLRTITGEVAGAVLLKSISHVFSPALDAGVVSFNARYPNVELIIETAPWDQIVTSLINGESALAVGFDELPRPELQHALLTRERMQVYCGPSHHLYGTAIQNPAILSNEPFIAFRDGEPPAWRMFRETYGLGRAVSGLADNIYEAWWLVSLGLGIGMLPEPTASSMATGKQLWPLLPPEMMPVLDIYLMWRPDMQDRAAHLLVETILERLAADNAAP